VGRGLWKVEDAFRRVPSSSDERFVLKGRRLEEIEGLFDHFGPTELSVAGRSVDQPVEVHRQAEHPGAQITGEKRDRLALDIKA